MKYKLYKLPNNKNHFKYRRISDTMKLLDWPLNPETNESTLPEGEVFDVELELLPGSNVRMAVVEVSRSQKLYQS